MILTCHNILSLIEPGDIVSLNGRARLVVSAHKRGIQFVRVGSSWCWNTKRNACAWYGLPINVEKLRAATDETRLLAERFENWDLVAVPDAAWQRVCALSVAAIQCECSD